MPPPSITCSSIVLIFEHVLFLLKTKVRCATLERFNHVNLLANEGINSEHNEDMHEAVADDEDSYQSDTVLIGESEAEDDYGSGTSNSNSSGSWVPECLFLRVLRCSFRQETETNWARIPPSGSAGGTRYTAIVQEASDQRAR
ncbi:hypothetical protein DFQ27_003823 [Actinomortierella ambigua]|uniref:Uncharacterized protein n=1 Tax=Actinomortierella ambigua TaxID=1343610 RepID=A0A9P6Q3K0_9FUNG|nr:hypothetical protein DFQ27_003823 [Actinomortierella ambigua]